MMTLTPVTVSKARMLRPSRPMIRPLTSSAGRCTTATTVCAVWSDATRWMASATIARARCLAEFWASRLDPPDHHRRVAADRLLLAGQQLGPGRLGGQPGDPDQFGLLHGGGGGQLLFPLGRAAELGRASSAASARERSDRACSDRLVAVSSPCSEPIRRRSATSACCSSASASVAARKPLLGLLEFLAVLGQRRGGLDGDPVPLVLKAGPQLGRLGPRGGNVRSASALASGRTCSASRRERTDSSSAASAAVRRTASAASAAASASWLSRAKRPRSGSAAGLGRRPRCGLTASSSSRRSESSSTPGRRRLASGQHKHRTHRDQQRQQSGQ